MPLLPNASLAAKQLNNGYTGTFCIPYEAAARDFIELIDRAVATGPMAFFAENWVLLTGFVLFFVVIEPLSLGKPVITGPHVWTIEYPAVEAEAAGVLSVVRDEKNLVAAIRQAMGGGADRAEAFHAANQGASARIYAAIRPLLEASQ